MPAVPESIALTVPPDAASGVTPDAAGVAVAVTAGVLEPPPEAPQPTSSADAISAKVTARLWTFIGARGLAAAGASDDRDRAAAVPRTGQRNAERRDSTA